MGAMTDARDVIHERLGLVLTKEVLEEIFGEGVTVPVLTIGGNKVRPPFSVDVAEVPMNVNMTEPSSCPVPQAEWVQEVAVTAQGQDLAALGAWVDSMAEVVCSVVMADRMLGGTVHEAHCSSSLYGTAVSDKGGYSAACVVQIFCRKQLKKLDPIWKEVLNDGSRRD